MGQASFRFHLWLADFLPPALRDSPIDYRFTGAPSLKHAIESLRVPHPEVGEPADLSRPVESGQHYDIHPRLWQRAEWRFVLDCHLGRLAKYLRILGFDTLYSNHADDAVLADISAAEGRVLLTMDRGLLMRRQLSDGYFVRARMPKAQLSEIIQRFHLPGHLRPLSRCLRCNTPLAAVDATSVWERIPPKTRLCSSRYQLCPGCGQLYWDGSHHEHMLAWIDSLGAAPPPDWY